ncbi:DUF6266 family protein [Olivibacter sitiensis]|uniref:DUF6266 family protein n=1 Tax=Olivibacter sitiensis TaxID=376470 RepID=UPI0003F5C96D|nr:DUF6266 family protein [Olivibacter sitiensis]
MARAKNGINGSFSGKVGSIIGYELNGQNVIRSVGRRTRPFSELELMNQAKMKAISQFLARIKPYVRLGFSKAAPAGSRVGAFQLAQSYAYKHAIAYDADNKPYLDPQKVLFAKGNRPIPHNCTAQLIGNRLEIRWENVDRSCAEDQLMVLLYDGEHYLNFRTFGAARRAQLDVWELDEKIQKLKAPVYVYAAFKDPYYGDVSDSVCCAVLI